MAWSRLQPALELTLPATLPGVEERSSAADAVQREVLALFDEHSPRLRRYVSSLGLGAETTEDVVQEVFLALFRHLGRSRSRSHLKAWLFQVAHNLALKQRYRIARRQATEGTWSAEAEEVLDPARSPEELVTDSEHRRRVMSILRALPDRDRQCLALRAEGLPYRDIARTLNISLGSVAKSLTRAIARLTTE